jgi:acetoin utilization deacetylase AcuC-like enzyme
MDSSQLTFFFCDHHDLPLPAGHKFPITKYRQIRELLELDLRMKLEPATFAAEDDIARVHAPGYVSDFLSGALDKAAIRRIGFPWSVELVRRTLASVGGTVASTRRALDYGIGGSLAGGTHHAFRSEGSGFCVFNDLAVAAEWARHNRGVERIAIVDLDVHQGDGTASIFENDRNVYTLSVHGEHNFPFRKQRSSLDIALPDGTGDREYLGVLEGALPAVWSFQPDLVFFQSGVDALAGDRLGRLSLSGDALAERDRMVLRETAEREIPVVITLGGGYGEPIGATVTAHAKTFQTAADIYVTSGP